MTAPRPEVGVTTWLAAGFAPARGFPPNQVIPATIATATARKNATCMPAGWAS